MTRPVLILGGVHKSFGRTEVLQGVDLQIDPGSVVGLLGRNGAGKSTLLKCLLGLLRVDEGTARVFGQDAWDLDASAKARLGYVAQEVQLYAWMSVRETFDYTGAFYDTWNGPLTLDLAQDWDLDPGAPVKSLSRGQLQKLGILLALGHEPELVILDEPAASLDPAARRDFLATLVDRVADLRATVLFSTHITSDLERIADRVAILKDGRIHTDQDLGELKESVKRIRLVGSTDLPRGLVVPEALRTRVRGKEAILSVSRCDDQLIRRLEREWQAKAEVHDLSLEDIFLEMHHG